MFHGGFPVLRNAWKLKKNAREKQAEYVMDAWRCWQFASLLCGLFKSAAMQLCILRSEGSWGLCFGYSCVLRQDTSFDAQKVLWVLRTSLSASFAIIFSLWILSSAVDPIFLAILYPIFLQSCWWNLRVMVVRTAFRQSLPPLSN
jgi:hypothetical protein